VRPAPPLPTIRTARIDDAELLVAAEREIVRTPGLLVSDPDEIRVEDFRAAIARAEAGWGHFLLAELDGAPVAHAWLDPLGRRRVRHVAHLTIAVHEGFQGRGLGKVLLSALIERARTDPTLAKIELNVRATNERAVRLYRSLGFVQEARWSRRVRLGPSEWVDDIGMGLHLR
jgi:ribosomal protein S18 acetylase RimI-like enzyme